MNGHEIETVIMPAVNHAAMITANGQILGDIEFSQNMLGNELALRMSRQVYSHRLADWEEIVEVPVNWWQHLKMQLGLKHKVRRQYAHVIRSRTFPDLPYLHPTLGVSFVQEDLISRYGPTIPTNPEEDA